MFSYYKTLDGGLCIMNSQAEHAEQLEELQRLCFPTLDESEIMQAKHYLNHLTLFPEGQFVILNEHGNVVGSTTTMRYNFDFEHPAHKFIDINAGGWLSTHQPDGEWLYGQDMGVHPLYRGRGLARIMYRGRQELVAHYKLKGQVAVGMMRGYGKVKDTMTGEAFYEALKKGEFYDPTITTQMSIGFKPIALIPDYLHDPDCGNYGVLIVLDASQKV